MLPFHADETCSLVTCAYGYVYLMCGLNLVSDHILLVFGNMDNYSSCVGKVRTYVNICIQYIFVSMCVYYLDRCGI